MKYFINEKEREASHSTCYLEFQEGQYHDKCWLDSSISISDEIWDKYQMSKLIHMVVPNFDFYGLTMITKEQWLAIVENSQNEDCLCKDVIQEAIPWVNKCFESNDVFTICGI